MPASAPRLFLLALPALAACSQIVGIQDYSNSNVDAPRPPCNPTTTKVATGMSPRDIALDDFDLDGKLDMIVPDGAANTLTLLFGKGDGTFTPGPSLGQSTLNVPSAVASGHLNPDGLPDVVVTNQNGSSADVLIGLGASSPYFQSPVTYQGSVQPAALVLADLDGNMRPDIAMTSSGTASFGVLLNNGDGTFQAVVDHTTCSGPEGITAGDFNGDGHVDIAVACSATNTVGLFLNAMSGNFTRLSDLPVGRNPTAILAADVNGDGKLDLIVANHDDNALSVLIGDGNGAFTPKPAVPTGNIPHGLAAGDLDGDGHVDLAVADFGANAVSVLHGNGDGTFQPKIDYPTGMGAVSVAIGKIDGDATPDLAVVNELDATVTVLLLGACK